MIGESRRVDIGPLRNLAGLGDEWRELEARATPSFFQSWAWTGCLAEERFEDPWLMVGRRGERIVALGLFNRARRRRLGLGRRILLGESGNAERDSIFIEHNGLLLDPAEPVGLAAACWAALENVPETRRARWELSGVTQAVADALPPGRSVRILARRPAPYLDLARLRASGISVRNSLSANARQQLARALRGWEKIGPLKLDAAGTADKADRFLDRLKELHQRAWTGRGKPGAFAHPFFERFHRALIRRREGRAETQLLRVMAGEREIGYLYNLIYGDWVASYQSGFDFSDDVRALRPGLVCHLLAIEHYAALGMARYDFLGGESRYKRSFSNAETELFWLEARRRMV